MKKKSKPFIIILVLICLWIVAESSMVVTYPNEFTVIKQFGKIVDVRENAGLSVKIPFIQKAEKIENEVPSALFRRIGKSRTGYRSQTFCLGQPF